MNDSEPRPRNFFGRKAEKHVQPVNVDEMLCMVLLHWMLRTSFAKTSLRIKTGYLSRLSLDCCLGLFREFRQLRRNYIRNSDYWRVNFVIKVNH